MFDRDFISRLNIELHKDKAFENLPTMTITDGHLRIQFSGEWGGPGMDEILDSMEKLIDLAETMITITWEENPNLGIGEAVAIISPLRK
jgi:hypothetical protein